VGILSHLYATAARRRRRAAARRPDTRRRLARPVISVGNLAVGGSGKTPLVRAIVDELLQAGERPAVLSRGYARTDPADGAVVVSDGFRLCADLPRAGDEPLMIARAHPSAIVVVAADRYLAGRLAELRCGATVHVLDDGFQHLGLWRDVDLVLLGEDDLAWPLTFPSGRLREPLDALAAADAVVWTGSSLQPGEVSERLAVDRVYRMARSGGALEAGPFGTDVPEPGTRVLALAGIARPDAFVDGLGELGLEVVAREIFRDHHPFDRADLARIERARQAHGAAAVVTTEKDAVRLLPHRPLPFRLAWRRLHVAVDGIPPFHEWLVERIARARAERGRTEPAA
jgi:tetraacyldisaccharide 4'-kinase